MSSGWQAECADARATSVAHDEATKAGVPVYRGVRNHTDPTDILKPQVYDIHSREWADAKREKRMAMRQFCS